MFGYQLYNKEFSFYTEKLRTLSKKLIGTIIGNNDNFSRKIRKRHKKFWMPANAETVRNTIMNAGDDIEKWKDVKNWQRKLSNKYNAREFAYKHNCKVAALYWKGRDCDNINFNTLSENYVIRPTAGHSSKLVFLMNHSINLMDAKKYAAEEIRQMLNKSLQDNAQTAFLIEEFVKTEKGEYKIPDDYKLYMFNGRVACIQVINRLDRHVGFTTWYDENWKPLPNLTTNYPDGKQQPAPDCLQEMLTAAKTLSTAYHIFCRIDFYATDKGAVFGEFTPTPALGKGFTLAGDNLLTEYWDKYCKGMI